MRKHKETRKQKKVKVVFRDEGRIFSCFLVSSCFLIFQELPENVFFGFSKKGGLIKKQGVFRDDKRIFYPKMGD